jgi:hypothetical protein
MKVNIREISFFFASYLRIGQSSLSARTVTIERLGIDNNITEPEKSGKDCEDM